MANIFGDAIGSLFGQKKAIPQQTYDFNDTLGKATQQSAAANLAYNQAYAPGIFDLQLGLEKKYDPNIAAGRAATSKSIFDNLALGGSLSPETQQLVLQNALQSQAASGFGLSQGGRAVSARDLGLTSLDLQNQRQGTAAQYVRSAPSLNSLYNPQTAFDPSEILGQNLQEQNLANERMAEEFIRKESNKVAVYNTFGRIAGGIVGGVYGGAAGAQAGAAAGGSVFNNPYRSDNGSQSNKGLMSGGGGGMSSMMSMFGGGGGGGGGGMGSFSGGAGQQYPGAGGSVQTSTRAQAYSGAL